MCGEIDHRTYMFLWSLVLNLVSYLLYNVRFSRKLAFLANLIPDSDSANPKQFTAHDTFFCACLIIS